MDVREYLTADGRNPYREWLETLDVTPRARNTQTVDVPRAQESWQAYQEGKRRGKTK